MKQINLILSLAAMLTMAQTAWADDITISSTAEWNTFANNVNNGTSYSGKTVKLNADISVTTMVGTYDNPFNGTFDGGGHTLNVTLNNDSQYGSGDDDYGVAPFRFTSGATIQFLAVTGIVTTSSRKYAAGLIGMTKSGTNTIMNCISSVEIYSSINGDGTHGGFIGKASGTVAINNCLFNGQLTTISNNPTTNCGGFVGWRDGSLTISNSLYAPNTTIPSGKVAVNNGATFSRNDVTPTNSFYTQTLGTAQGTAVGSKTAEQLVATLGSGWRVSSGRAVPKLLLSSKSFTIANVSNKGSSSLTTILYDSNDFLVPISGMQNNGKDGSGITMRSNVGDEGIVRLYPRISGNVKSISFSSAKVDYSSTVGAGSYLKIGMGNVWSNSYSETMSSYTTMFFSSENGMQLANEDDYLEIRMKNTNTTRQASFFIQGTLTITYEPTASTLTHTHNFSYSKDGSTLTATCAHNDGKECSLASSNWQISTTLTPPTHATYGQYVYHSATLSDFSLFSAETGATAGDITYVNNTTSESLGTSSPHDIGAYTASVTINADNYPYTLTASFNVGTFCGINTNYPQFTTDKEGNYAMDGETVTITFTPKFGETLTSLTVTGATTNYSIGSGITDNGNNTYTFTMPQEEVSIGATFTAPDASHFEQSGDTYTIKSANGWGWFCFTVSYDLAPNGFSGKTVKLATSVGSSEMAGKSGHPFKGTFDGQGNTLTFSLQASEGNSAPFRYTDGSTIRNLHVGGTITGGDNTSLGGLVGYATGNITISNCHVSTQISTTHSGAGFHGGIIAFWDDSNVECTITGCVYDGLIYNPSEANVTSYCSGFIGNFWGRDKTTVTFTDCLYAPAEYTDGKKALREDYGCGTFFYPDSDPTYRMTNCYYTRNLGKRQGRPATTATTAPANLGNATTDHGMVKGYKNGFLYDGNYYTPKYGDVVVEYPFNEYVEQASVTINGTNDDQTGVNLVGVNITEDIEKVSSVTYNRKFTSGQAATVILPFNYICNENEGSEGGKFYGFKEVTYDYDQHIWVCTMQEPGNTAVTTLTANTPYLFMPNDATMTFPNIVNMTGGVVTLQTTTANDGLYGGATTDAAWNFHGSYKGKTWTGPSDDYGFAAKSGEAVGGEAVEAGQFVRFAPGAFIKPMRCYLSYVGTEAPAPARGLTRSAVATDDLPQSITVRLVSRSGETTAIGTLDTKTGKMTFFDEQSGKAERDSEAWYTLDGVRLSGKPSTKGIYINNGKKIVIK